jgi:flavin-dependent dehydrogenase
LVERCLFPRDHVGEALAPGVRSQLDFLGLSSLLDADRSHTFPQARISWTAEGFECRPMHPQSTTVDRAVFDHALLKAAKGRGVTVLQPCTAQNVRETERGWNLNVQTANGPFTVTAQFIVDASGRRGFLRRRRRLTAPLTIAIHGYWGGRNLPAEPRIWAGRRGWIWGSPVPGRGFSAIIFTDRSGLHDGRGTLSDRYRTIVGESPIFSKATRTVVTSKVSVCDATSYVDEDSEGSRYLKVGEAAFALDPLSSTGVQKAIQTGLTAAVVINTVLSRSGSEALARQFHREQQEKAITQHTAWTGEAYRENRRYRNEPFWRERSLSEAPAQPQIVHTHVQWAWHNRVALSAQTLIKQAPVLIGDFIESHYVLEHPRLPGPVAFVDGIEAVRLLEGINGSTVGVLIDRIRSIAPADRVGRIMDWLASNQIIDLAVEIKDTQINGPIQKQEMVTLVHENTDQPS